MKSKSGFQIFQKNDFLKDFVLGAKVQNYNLASFHQKLYSGPKMDYCYSVFYLLLSSKTDPNRKGQSVSDYEIKREISVQIGSDIN